MTADLYVFSKNKDDGVTELYRVTDLSEETLEKFEASLTAEERVTALPPELAAPYGTPGQQLACIATHLTPERVGQIFGALQ